MRELALADRVEVLVLVDNVTDNLSTVPEFVEHEFRRFWKRGGRILSGQCLCCAAHGLSCAITAWRGDIAKTLLFDTGPDVSVFERNVERLGFDMGAVDGIVLSHGHWDHGGAMLRALDDRDEQRRSRGPHVHVSGMYRTRARARARARACRRARRIDAFVYLAHLMADQARVVFAKLEKLKPERPNWLLCGRKLKQPKRKSARSSPRP